MLKQAEELLFDAISDDLEDIDMSIVERYDFAIELLQNVSDRFTRLLIKEVNS